VGKRSFPEGRRWREFWVVVDKDSNSQSIGLDIDKADGETMLVVKVKPGPVDNHNRARLGEEVRRGDRIMSINGISGDVVGMLKALESGQKVELRLRRLVEFLVRVVKKSRSEKLGIDVDHGSDEHLVVTRIPRQLPVSMTEKAKATTPSRPSQNSSTGVPAGTFSQTSPELGPVRRYNDEVTAETELRLADIITEVNGFSGTGGKVREMLQRIATEDSALIFHIKRPGEDTAATGVLV
jgi:C-terminal processing protease CtpA/Prc